MIKKFLSCCFTKTPKTYPNTLSDYETLCLLIEKVNECVEQVNALTEIITNYSYEIANGSITTPKLANSAVTNEKIANVAVTSEKIGVEEVETKNLRKECVTTSRIAPEAVTTDKVGVGAVINSRLAPDAVTQSKIKNNSVTTEKVANGAITPLKLSPEVRALNDSLYVEQTTALGVYARDFREGAETTSDVKIPFTYTDGTPNSIVQRDGNGRVVVGEPVDNYNPVPFRWLNELSEQLNGRISQLSSDLDILAYRVSALEQA